MDSSLGVTFANYYMINLRNTLFDNEINLKPVIYCCYIDDCSLIINSDIELNNLVHEFHRASALSFTTELGDNRKLIFLRVSINGKTGYITTSVFRKLTNSGIHLRDRSDCSDRYTILRIKRPPYKK